MPQVPPEVEEQAPVEHLLLARLLLEGSPPVAEEGSDAGGEAVHAALLENGTPVHAVAPACVGSREGRIN